MTLKKYLNFDVLFLLLYHDKLTCNFMSSEVDMYGNE